MISVIIPLYNREDFILKTLQSLQEQTYSNWECIIVDDHSTDNSFSIVKEFSKKESRIKIYKRPEILPKGACSCRNYGVTMCSGEYINFFDSDDIFKPNFLQELLTKITQNSNFRLSCCSAHTSDKELNIIETYDLSLKEDYYKNYLLWKFQVVNSSILYKRSFLEEQEQLFNPKIVRYQDTEMFTRILKKLKDNEWGVVNKPLYYYIRHDNAKSSKNKYNPKVIESISYVFKQILELNEDDTEICKKYIRDLIGISIRSHLNKDKSNYNDIMTFLENNFRRQKYKLFIIRNLIKLPKGHSIAARSINILF